jgi:hypothetical protein
VVSNFFTRPVIFSVFLGRSARQIIAHMEEAKIFRKAYNIFVKYFGSETNKNLRK